MPFVELRHANDVYARLVVKALFPSLRVEPYEALAAGVVGVALRFSGV